METHGKKRVIAQDQLDEMILFLILKDYPYNTQYLQLSIVKKKKMGTFLIKKISSEAPMRARGLWLAMGGKRCATAALALAQGREMMKAGRG